MFTCYEPRLCAFLGIRGGRDVSGYQLKTYSIVEKNVAFELDRFEPCMNLITSSLPLPAVTTSRPGVGFLIFHQGATGDYAVVCWWDNQNELPTRVFVRDDNQWRPARVDGGGGESFCVWDLKVIWHEREAYVQTVLAGAGSDLGIEQYMNKTLNGNV